MSIIVRSLDKPEKCTYCGFFRYYYENGRIWCNAANQIIATIPYEERLLDSTLENIPMPAFCPIEEYHEE